MINFGGGSCLINWKTFRKMIGGPWYGGKCFACHFALLCKQTQNFIWHQAIQCFFPRSACDITPCANFPLWLMGYYLPTTECSSFVLHHEILQSTLVLTESLWIRVKNHVRDLGKDREKHVERVENRSKQQNREANENGVCAQNFVISLCLISIYQIKHDRAIFFRLIHSFGCPLRWKISCTKASGEREFV